MRYSIKKSSGFVLVASIWIMAALVLMVSTFAIWVESSLNTAIEQNRTNAASIDASSTQQVLLYLLATQESTPAGITMPQETNSNPQEVGISLDDFLGGASVVVDDMGSKTVSVTGNELLTNDTVYKGVESALFSIKDMAGLIPINSPSSQHMEKFLLAAGVGEQQVQTLLMSLQDYIDKDDVVRPNGAEAFQYLRQGLTVLRNGPLRSKYELENVMGWKAVSDLWTNESALSSIEAVSTEPYNINAISAKVAQVAFDLSEAQAQRLIDERAQAPYKNMQDLAGRTGLDLYAHWEQIKFYTSEHFRLSFYTSGTRLKRELNVYFPTQGRSPWVIHSDLTVPLTDTNALVEPRQPQTSFFR
ncbi:general secretion pathway protein GspK [Alteromonas sp. S015]|uniref:general secretion pathway protein GspK n=1 Tax=Alteromonas sp. S015 TaxID=3117401 RepID=UPI002FE0A9AE